MSERHDIEGQGAMQTFSSRDFQRAPGVIKRAAVDGAVIITERGRPIIAVMPFAEYERLKAPPGNILDALDMDEVGDIDVDFSRPATFPRPAVFD
ncbi:MAG: type II toxin-antitoxin system Phd/YefM family antitoxin [Sphingomonas sanguinis]|jgi:prevent-host-death family protein|nr:MULTISPECIES: type II toxin-antitoxin system Phd/YefM family antitoxin [Sphingomonas]MBZ6383916.1 type II toxin-antitoxin system Phd/YefM family antitoxin [Sphingomonas sanguinis]NNG51436.1 type II toxin-antitoxin system Phd/YefM family antitoxin [Sphingomonas sanguinis]NVP33207.1 type II toxin-antitoxin system Phd/YefM family antitoxin [Sphingomonas sanguinis]